MSDRISKMKRTISGADAHVDADDGLLQLYRDTIVKQVKETEAKVEKKQTSEIFEFDENMRWNEPMHGMSMNLLDRLLHQWTRPAWSNNVDDDNDEFTVIDETEITTVINNGADFQTSSEEMSLVEKIRSFIDELGEETEVIRGSIDEETLRNRRRYRTKSWVSMIDTNKRLVSQTSI